jgi:hypothetical protein
MLVVNQSVLQKWRVLVMMVIMAMEKNVERWTPVVPALVITPLSARKLVLENIHVFAKTNLP